MLPFAPSLDCVSSSLPQGNGCRFQLGVTLLACSEILGSGVCPDWLSVLIPLIPESDADLNLRPPPNLGQALMVFRCMEFDGSLDFCAVCQQSWKTEWNDVPHLKKAVDDLLKFQSHVACTAGRQCRTLGVKTCETRNFYLFNTGSGDPGR